jgi:hypothetical protein
MTWTGLNERQQQYLQAIYETDQEQETDERGSLSMEIMGEQTFGEKASRERT